MSDEYDTLSLRNRDVTETLSKVSDLGCAKDEEEDKVPPRSSPLAQPPAMSDEYDTLSLRTRGDFDCAKEEKDDKPEVQTRKRKLPRNGTDPETAPPPNSVNIHWEEVRKHWEETKTAKEYYLATGGSPIFQMEEGQDHSSIQISYKEDVEEFTSEEGEPYTEPYNASVDEDGVYMFACGVKGHANRGEIVRINTVSQESMVRLDWRDLRRHWKKTGNVKTFYLETGGRVGFKPETGHDHQVCLLDCPERFDDCNLTNCEQVSDESMDIRMDGIFLFACGVEDHCKDGEKARVVVSPSVFHN